MLTANAAFDEPDLPVGRIFAASHSGSMIGALLSRGKARGIGFAGLVSVGNEVDLSIGEICAATLDDPDIDGYVLFLETMRNSEALRAFALARRRAASRSRLQARPLGRRARACRLAHRRARRRGRHRRAHFLADCGIARVDTLEGLIEGLPLVRRVPIRPVGARAPTRRRGDHHRRRRHHGGRSARDARHRDRAAERRDLRALKDAARVDVTPARIVDLTLAGTRYDVMKAALDILTTAPEFDWCWSVVGSSARFHPELAVRRSSTARAPPNRSRRFWCPKRRTRWRGSAAAGVPSFHTPEACADAIAAALQRRTRRKPIEVRFAQAAAAACSTSLRPTRCSTGSAFRARRRRARYDDHASTRPALPLSGRRQGAVRRHRRTRPTPAAWC
jgi:hypothetical protein